ncbi:RNA polymerase sigma factor [Streptomyces caniferus]|uniref:hypothetical protein n=1 Tax=Streptomyces caniferus TaxID=285557 RepID=UPI003806FF56
MNEDQMPDCLGCSDEPSRQAVVFPNGPAGDARADSPTGLYADRARWCQPCWVYRDPFHRFHLLYSRRLRSYIGGTLRHLPFGQRETAVDEVAAEAMAVLWEKREKLNKPERAMYRVAKWTAWRRHPLERKETPADLEKMRPAFEYIRFLTVLAEVVRMISHWLSG